MFGSAKCGRGHGARRALGAFPAGARPPAPSAVALIALLAAGRGAGAGSLVINEVLYDPAGADAGLEFVEILNAGTTPIDLGLLRLETGDGASAGAWRLEWTGLPGVPLEPGRYWCIGEESVEPPPDAVTDLDLQNGPDACRLVLDGTVCDVVGWGAHTLSEFYRGSPAEDVTGVSLGRVPDGADTGDNGRDFEALDPPSPGEPNAYAFDLALPAAGLEREPALPDAPGRFLWRVTVLNVGIETSAGAALRIEGGDLPAVREVPALERGESALIEIPDAASEAGVFARVARLDWEDDRHPANDTLAVRFRAGPGPLLFNEIAYAPPRGLPEWIEIVNAGAEPVDPSGWSVCDSHDEPVALPSGLPAVAPGGYLVVSEKPLAEVESAVPQGAWPALNNVRQAGQAYADRLRLADPEGLLSDEVAYSPEWGGGQGITLERVSRALRSREGSNWGSCAAPGGGTPGSENSIAVALPAGGGIQAEPSPFSPDGDGIDDRTLIAVEVPAGSVAGTARIYDLAGREVRDLGSITRGRARVLWDGLDGGGRAAPLGFYVVVASGRRDDGSAWRLSGPVVVASPLRPGGR